MCRADGGRTTTVGMDSSPHLEIFLPAIESSTRLVCFSFRNFGAGGWNRTTDPQFTKLQLYQLSYASFTKVIGVGSPRQATRVRRLKPACSNGDPLLPAPSAAVSQHPHWAVMTKALGSREPGCLHTASSTGKLIESSPPPSARRPNHPHPLAPWAEEHGATVSQSRLQYLFVQSSASNDSRESNRIQSGMTS